ncbi:vacuolar protein sorting-associated protein IST1-like [Pyrus communis]|uniref:vacuolar protein sorting-associated protein IST1-like n=1 Tax=Pyrus communis TaxID=23211 RepID=UPI0035C1AD18
MSMLDSFFNKGFKAAKCKTMLKLTIPRIKLLRNRREIQIKQMRRDIAKLLETGQEATARIRVEHIIREENMMAAQEILELFSELIAVRLPIIESQRECPIDLKEAISSVCFAAPRCADLPELLQVQMLFASKYGKEFVAAATELIPDCGVNRQLIELLSVRAPSPEKKLKLLKEIAEEHDLDWDPAASEAEIYKPHEDLLSGPTQFVSGSKLPLPKEKHDETLQYSPDQDQKELSDSDDGLDSLDFPEVPKQSLRPSANPASAPAMSPPLPTQPHPEIDHDLSKKLGSIDSQSKEPSFESGEVMEERSVANNQEQSHVSVGAVEDKQFLPFISSPSLSSASFSTRQSNPPPNLSRTRSEVNVDLQDVLAAAQAAADSAERAATAARSAASLAQVRINEITKKNSEEVPETSCENPFHVDVPNQSDTREKPNSNHLIPDGGSAGVIDSPVPHQIHLYGQGSEISNASSITMEPLNVDFDSAHSNDHASEHDPVRHQPQRLASMEDDPYFSYPNLFTSQNSNVGSDAHSSTDNPFPSQGH